MRTSAVVTAGLLSSLLVCPAALRSDVAPGSVGSTSGLAIDLAGPSTSVSPILHGLMTEEINYSYDGGLYGELIRNRAFRDDDASAPVHWASVKEPGSDGTIQVVSTHPLTDKLPNSLEVDVTSASAAARFGVSNDGYWGIPVRPNTRFHVSFYVRGDSITKDRKTGKPEGHPFEGTLHVSLEAADGATVYARAETAMVDKHWHHVEVTLTTGPETPVSAKARFVISSGCPGRFWLSLVSLFPPTYHDRANGFRVDLMEKLAAMKPHFIRFPGGNYLEGNTLWERFDWKATLGALPFRAGHPSCWNYRSTDGMGLMEFMNWCEDLGAEPVLAIYAGYSLKQQAVEPGPLLAPYVQDALDEIEYLTADATASYWGARRAADGHPAPFQVNYVEVGNEDYFDKTGSYDARFTQFYDALKAKYPKIQLIATDRAAKTRTPDLYDDHFYRKAEAFYKDLAHYDTMDRNGPKVFVGEWATREGEPTPNFKGALGDAAWMTSMERNSDLIVMHCYAPLFVNVNPGGMQWKTDLIGYDTMTSYGSPAYYAQVMFANHIGDRSPKATFFAGPGVFLPYSVTRVSSTGKVIIKVVNPASVSRSVAISISGAGVKSLSGHAITLQAPDPEATNSITEPTKIIPVDRQLPDLASQFSYEFPACSITVLEVSPR